ncbi:MAG: hypothetical protein KJO65_08325, partial [Gemmatimonadetes bacterium]|nr:hypothetical protein [Gemmatimonadota bacterium]
MSSPASFGWSLSDADRLRAVVGPRRAGGQARRMRVALVVGLPLVVGLARAPLVGPTLAAQETAPSVADSQRDGRGWFRSVLGVSPERNRVIVGLWAMHPFEPQFPEVDGTRGFGGLYGHWFGTTFVNSYDERTWALGIERDWVRWRRGRAGLGVGYRVGLIAGYDERLVEIGRHTPVLPFGGVLVWARFGPVAVDSYYV